MAETKAKAKKIALRDQIWGEKGSTLPPPSPPPIPFPHIADKEERCPSTSFRSPYLAIARIQGKREKEKKEREKENRFLVLCGGFIRSEASLQ